MLVGKMRCLVDFGADHGSTAALKFEFAQEPYPCTLLSGFLALLPVAMAV
jgi:hypothetical protein